MKNRYGIYRPPSKQGITIGQELGIFPMYSKLPTRWQYFSKLHNEWRDANSEWDLKQYEKYEYETRILFN